MCLGCIDDYKYLRFLTFRLLFPRSQSVQSSHSSNQLYSQLLFNLLMMISPKVFSLVLTLASASFKAKAIALPEGANVQSSYHIASPANLGSVQGNAEVPITWLGQVFENGPNVTVTGPSLTAILEKIVEINPEHKLNDGSSLKGAMADAAAAMSAYTRAIDGGGACWQRNLSSCSGLASP
jgi:hypothetical protein